MNKARAKDFETTYPADTAGKHFTSRCKTMDRSNVVNLLPIDGPEFKEWFAPTFARLLQDRFANPEQIAAQFGIRNSTAWNWWTGSNKASGDAVARAFLMFPDAVAWFQQEWEQR